MSHAKRLLLRALPPGLPLPLRIVLKLGVTSDELMPVLILAARHPEKLRVGLTEDLSFTERWLLLTTMVAAPLVVTPLLVASAVAGVPALGVLAISALALPGLAFLVAYPWRLRAVIIRRAFATHAVKQAKPDAVSMSLFLDEAIRHPAAPPR
ncbi:hypothetical protein [Myxococcus sp. Y35]|uniref:hypothetical protein n=1 Tax=Pseudomyxococcus flavus TaxID=3115648 RepID=UPI003CEDAAB0